MSRQAEVAASIRRLSMTMPWPQVRETLLDQGVGEEEIEAAIDEAFPGRAASPKRMSSFNAGLVGAVIGALLWGVLALLYKKMRG